MIQARDLIEKFYIALNGHWGYIYGMTHEMWSLAKQNAYEKEYAGDPDREQSVQYGSKWIDHWVTDCSGLFKWSFSQLGGSIAHGSNSIWNGYITGKGTLSGGKRTDGQELKPGTAVFTSSGEKHNHIGLYVGGGMVIEAQGTLAGVVSSVISNKKWTHWGELKNVSYTEKDDGGERKTMKAKVVLPSGAGGTTVNARASSETKNGKPAGEILFRVPVGAEVDVMNDQGNWCFIEYGGKTGWMMSNYLEYDGQDGESGEAALTEDEKARIDASLKAIENAVEVIGGIIGRG